MLAAVNNGDTIRISIDFNNCLTVDDKTPNTTRTLGAFTPNEIIVTDNGDILSSLNHFTTNDPAAPNQPVYEFVRYAINSYNFVNVAAQVLDAATYKPVTAPAHYSCKLDDSAKVYKKD